MRSDSEIFSVSGPSYLNSVDWKHMYSQLCCWICGSCEQHRRCILASVVQAVYILEHDRQLNRVGPTSSSTAPTTPCSEPSSTSASRRWIPAAESPKCVVAFRGALTGATTRSRDLFLDLKCVLNTLHHSFRFHLALRSIQHAVAIAGPRSVWLTGHSLGSAISLLAGRHVARSGYNLPTCLFKSPFTSVPLERINHQKPKQGIHIASSAMKAGLSATLTVMMMMMVKRVIGLRIIYVGGT